MSKYYKHPQYGRVYGEPIATPEGRVAWPNLVTPRENTAPDGKKTLRYEITLLLDKKSPQTDVFLDKLNTMLNDPTDGMLALFNKGNSVRITLPDSILKDGDEFDMEKYPYYAGKYVVVARNQETIPVRGKTKEGVDPAVVKGGVLAKVVLTPHIGPTGLSFKADKVQFLADDGTRFGGGGRDVDRLLDVLDETDSSEADAVLDAEETKVEAVPNKPMPASKSPAQIQAELRARAGGGKAPQVSTTGKGKKLALNNL